MPRKKKSRRSKRRGAPSRIQSLAFDKELYTIPESRNWLRSHGFKFSLKPDITLGFYRFRQLNPGLFNNFRVKPFTPGISAIVAW